MSEPSFKGMSIVLGFISILSCSHKTSYDPSLYMGTYRSLDMTVPYPFFLEFHKDGIYFRDFTGKVIDQNTRTLPYEKGDTIQMQENAFLILNKSENFINIFDLLDTTRFPKYEGEIIGKYRAKMVTTTQTPNLNLDKAKSILIGKTFSSKVMADNPNDGLEVVKYLQFTSNQLTTIRTYSYQGKEMWSEFQNRPYHIFELENKIFFSENVDASNPQTMYQVIGLKNDAIQLRYYEDDDEQLITYTHVDIVPDLAKRFEYSNCFDGIQGEYYHNHPDVTFAKGNEFILNFVNENAPKDKGNGRIIIQFNVNCHGKIGRLGLLQMDNSYQATQFSSELVKHIIEKVTSLNQWPKTESSDKKYYYNDAHAFLMFKIENGKITDVCP